MVTFVWLKNAYKEEPDRKLISCPKDGELCSTRYVFVPRVPTCLKDYQKLIQAIRINLNTSKHDKQKFKNA